MRVADNGSALRLLWFAFAFSLFGDQVTRIALTWHVWETTQSSGSVALLSICYGAPLVIGGLIAGPLIDRYGAGYVMRLDNLLRGSLMLIGAVIATLGSIDVWMASALAAAHGLMAMLTLAGIPVLITQILDGDARTKANARELMSYNAAGILGPAVGTLLLQIVGLAGVLLVDAASYFALAAILKRWSNQRLRTQTARDKAEGTVKALQVIFTQPILRNVTIMFMAFNVGSAAVIVLLPQAATGSSIPGLSPAHTYTVWITAIAVGQVVGAATIAGIPLQRIGIQICLFQFLAGASIVSLTAAAPVTSALALFTFGLLTGPLTVWAQTLRMSVIPAHLRGRIFALLRLTMQSGNPIGAALAGALSTTASILLMIATSGVVIGAAGLLGLTSSTLRRAARRA